MFLHPGSVRSYVADCLCVRLRMRDLYFYFYLFSDNSGEAGGEFALLWVRQRARGSDWVRHRGERPTLGEAWARASHIG